MTVGFLLPVLILATLVDMKWHLIVGLVHLSLRTNDFQHIFMCSLPFCSFSEVSVQVFCPFLESDLLKICHLLSPLCSEPSNVSSLSRSPNLYSIHYLLPRNAIIPAKSLFHRSSHFGFPCPPETKHCAISVFPHRSLSGNFLLLDIYLPVFSYLLVPSGIFCMK